MAPLKITATRAVWMNSYHTPDELLSHIERGDYGAAMDIVCLYGAPEREKFCEYTRVGEAEVTMTLLPRDQQTKMAVQALNQKLSELRAVYMQKQQEILDQISKLQAITFDAE